MTFAELVHEHAQDCVNVTYEYHGAFDEQKFRKYFEHIVDFSYSAIMAQHIKNEERDAGMISLLFHLSGGQR